jgi:hypothetical protein
MANKVLGFAPRPFDRLALSRMKRPSRPCHLADSVTRRRIVIEKAPTRPKPLYHDPKAVFTHSSAEASLLV